MWDAASRSQVAWASIINTSSITVSLSWIQGAVWGHTSVGCCDEDHKGRRDGPSAGPFCDALGRAANLPTVDDFVPGHEVSTWFGVGAPTGTPAEIVDKLNTEMAS
jgi:hypothetical protein